MRIFFASFFAIITFFNMAVKNISQDDKSLNQNQQPLFTFGIIADAQYADIDPVGTRFYRSSLVKLREAVNSFKEDSADFIINLGDLIDGNFISYNPVMEIIGSSGLKTYHVAGNHDYYVDPGEKQRLPVLTSREGYYSFVYEKFRFIFLNGNEISTYVSNNKTTIKYANELIATLKKNGEMNAVVWNGGISNKQLTWLTNQLDDAAHKYEKVFLICHFPINPENVHNLLNFREVLPILEKYNNIIAWFNGHNHEGNYGNFNMIHFVTFRGMVETESSNSYALVEVYNNKLLIRGSGREKSQILPY